MTSLFHNLKELSARVESDDDFNSNKYLDELQKIDKKFQDIAISKQVFVSDAYAHYKFFGQMQIEWIDRIRPFSLWRDKIPFTAYPFLAFILLAVIIIFILKG